MDPEADDSIKAARPAKRTQPVGRCIFCNREGNLTKQHLFADRFKTIIPRKDNLGFEKTRTAIVGDSSDNTIKLTPLPIVHSSAHPGTMKLRILCAECNNGWVSAVENKAISLLQPIITNGRDGKFGKDEQATIALYLATFFVMLDQDHPQTSGITQEERDFIYMRRSIPSNWYLFVGHCASTDWNYRFRHHGGEMVAPTRTYRYQICTASIGCLVMHAASSADHNIFTDVSRGTYHGLAPVYPYQSEFDVEQLPWLVTRDVDRLADEATQHFMTSVVNRKARGR